MSQDTLPVLTDLTDTLARDKHCLAAAELELSELQDMRTRLEEKIAYAEREVRKQADAVDKSWRAVRRRIDAETDSPLETELVRARCLKALAPLTMTAVMFGAELDATDSGHAA